MRKSTSLVLIPWWSSFCVLMASSCTTSVLKLNQAFPTPAELQAGLSATPLLYVDGQIILDPGKVRPDEESKYRSQLSLARRGLAIVRNGALTNTRKVAVFDGDEVDIVVFDLQLPEGTLGGDFAYSVMMDKGTGSVVSVRVSD